MRWQRPFDGVCLSQCAGTWGQHMVDESLHCRITVNSTFARSHRPATAATAMSDHASTHWGYCGRGGWTGIKTRRPATKSFNAPNIPVWCSMYNFFGDLGLKRRCYKMTEEICNARFRCSKQSLEWCYLHVVHRQKSIHIYSHTKKSQNDWLHAPMAKKEQRCRRKTLCSHKSDVQLVTGGVCWRVKNVLNGLDIHWLCSQSLGKFFFQQESSPAYTGR